MLDDRTGSGIPDVKILFGEDEYTYTYTDAAGAYRFHSLPAGTYEVRIGIETLPFGYQPVGPLAIPVRIEKSGDDVRCSFRLSRPVRVTEF